MSNDPPDGQAQSKPRSKKTRNPERTRRRILDAAETEFALKGYEGARLREVAQNADVNHALVHHYFGDKEGLFRAVLERALGAVSAQALQLLRTATATDTRELIERYVDLVVDFYVAHINLVRIFHFASLDESSPAYAMILELGGQMLTPLLESAASLVARAQERGEMRADISPERIMTLTMGAAAYLFTEARLFSLLYGQDASSEEVIAAHKDAARKIFLDGLLT